VAPTLGELAEDAMAYLLPRPLVETVRRDALVLIAGPGLGWVVRIRRPDVAWVREEARRRGLPTVEWWVGWSAPAGTVDELLAHGLEVDETPWLVGMTCSREPPDAPDVDVRRIGTGDEYLAAVQVDWTVWRLDEEERARRRAFEIDRFDLNQEAGTVHHWAAYDRGRPVGFARAVDMEHGVTLLGGAVLPEARRRGVYRALVHARWRHAAGRGTPTLVVQAGAMSAPVLDGLGFVRHGDLRLFVDRLEKP
jgi:GNAT superfamily N-acetyltransferase